MATVVETKLKQERLLRIIEDELQDLPPLPAVVMRVMQTINDPTTSASDLNRLISGDQALASKVLRLVNSSYYGFPRRISTITHAVVILGFNTVRNLTTSLGVFNAFDIAGREDGAGPGRLLGALAGLGDGGGGDRPPQGSRGQVH